MSEDSSSSSSSASSSSSSSSDGNLAAIRAKFASKQKDAKSERQKRNRGLKKKITKTVSQKSKIVATVAAAAATTDESSKRSRRQPSETAEEQVDKILQRYFYEKLHDLCPRVSITEQACAIAADALKVYVSQVTERGLHFSAQPTVDGKRAPIQVLEAWGAVRTLAPKAIVPAILKSAIDSISSARGTQESSSQAWETYVSLPDDALQVYETQKMLNELE